MLPRKAQTAAFIAALLLILPYLSGCATIVRGSDQEVQISSEPPNATILVNGEDRGETPTTLTLGTDRNYQIEFQKDGYASETLNVTQKFTIGWPIVGNFFSWGLIGIVVDVATGSAYKLEPEQLNAALESTSASANIPEGSDIHVVLFSKEDVEEKIDLSESTRVEFSIAE